ncbi:hypothetical protein [Aporhodopirellula aestuarii]|uniref:Uncharacterized protein n=1 Tax=Aporhodopirellula aestuarii TaxID=2950107 RepID=A0ABT0U237_9BACT|nr:hypothetical protein [Aporhodopirellula aestuarii]MCM2370932.1 hypothetical protein [Aporhodopirellula aestuarii]
MSESTNNLNSEKLRCPECEKSFSTKKTMGIGDDRSIPCPNCRKENKLGLWRVADEPEEEVAFMPVESPPVPPDTGVAATPVPEPIVEPQPGKGEHPSPASMAASMVSEFAWMLFLVPTALAFIVSCLLMLGNMASVLGHRDRFATDNAYGAAANALEQIEAMFATLLCLIVTVILFQVLRWALKASNRTKRPNVSC